MKLYTIGFTQKTAQHFFDLLRENRIERLVDIRLHAEGQLAGFAKKDDLRYFLDEILRCDYIHIGSLSPTDEVMKGFRTGKEWEKNRAAFLGLLKERDIPASLDRSIFEEKTCCLLCSEAAPDHCHRRLVAETLAAAWGDVEIIHV